MLIPSSSPRVHNEITKLILLSEPEEAYGAAIFQEDQPTI